MENRSTPARKGDQDVDPEAFQAQVRYIIPPVCSGSTLGSPPSWTGPEYLQEESFSH